MNNKNFQQNDIDTKDNDKSGWKTVGIIALALALAILTVFIINLNR